MSARDRIEQAGLTEFNRDGSDMFTVSRLVAREALLIAKERITSWQSDEDDEGTEIAICGYCYESGVIHKWDCPIAIIEKIIDEDLSDVTQGAETTTNDHGAE